MSATPTTTLEPIRVTLLSESARYTDGAVRCRLHNPNNPVESVAVVVNPDQSIMWCDDWCQLTDWALAGLMRCEFKSGHGDPYAQEERYYV